MARLVFMGSPAFAVPTLDALAREHEILAVFAQPDKPAGRGRRLAPVPVKTWAAERGLPVVQPGSLRKEPGAVERLRALKPDVVVVAAYGLILPQAVLDAAPHGCLNVHASLLPKYRGAAPIPAAILNGDAETGVTIMRMDAGVDTGPILAQAREPIRPDDTALTLGARLADLGARLMVETLPRVLRGEIAPIAQDESQATLSPKIDKQSGRIDWSKPAVEIDRLIRAYTPWPGAFTQWSGMDLKIVRASVNEYATNTALALRAARCKCQRISNGWAADKRMGESAHQRVNESTNQRMGGAAGLVIGLGKNGAGVVTGDGVLELREVQLAGKRAMPIEEFLRGHAWFIGSKLGDTKRE